MKPMSSMRILAAVGFVAILTAPGAGAQSPDAAALDGARNEAMVVWYTSSEIELCEKLAAVFQGRYPGIKVQVERSGAERIFQRISQENSSRVYNADLVETSDEAQFLAFKRDGMLVAAMPAEVAKFWPKEARDPDGQYAATRISIQVMAYNKRLVQSDHAPKSYLHLLDPNRLGRL